MSENKWLRFCYETPMDISHPDGFVTRLLGIRSDGIMYEVHVFTEQMPMGEVLAETRRDLRIKLETFIDDVPEGISPHPHPDRWLKGIIYQNGDEWVEAV